MAIFILLGVIPFYATADNPSTASGINFLRQWIYIAESPVSENGKIELVIEIPESSEQYIFSEECKYTESKMKPFYFSCREDGKSPLAGATYKVTTFKNDCGEAIIYECISGCGPKRVPPRFDAESGEC